MIPRVPIVVLGGGVVTSVGATTSVVCAAIPGSVSRFQQHPVVVETSDGEATLQARAAPIVGLPDESTEARLSVALDCALSEALTPLRRSRAPVAVSVQVVVPSDLPMLSDGLRSVVTRAFARELPAATLTGAITTATGGHAAGLLAIGRASAALDAGAVPLALVIAADSRLDARVLSRAAGAGRLHGDDNPWGFVPGEGVSCVLLASAREAERHGARPFGRIAAWGAAVEARARGPLPNVGEALTKAWHEALAPVGRDDKVAAVVCDLNGERLRTDEWALTLPRISDRLLDASGFVAPAMTCGDLGTAFGPLSVLVAARSVARRQVSGKWSVAWAASDDGDRAAVTIECIEGAEESTIRHAAPRAPMLAALDTEVIDEIATECIFRRRKRGAVVATFERAPLPDWTAASSTEAMVDAMVDGLAACGDDAANAVVSRAGSGDPNAVYVATRVVLEARGLGAAATLIETFPLDSPEVREAAAAALADAPERARPAAAASALMARGGSWPVIGVTLVCQGVVAAGTWMSHATAAPPADVARATGLDPAADAATISRWLRHPDPATRTEAALATLRKGGAAWVGLVASALPDEAVLLPLALAADRAIANHLRGLHGKLSTSGDYLWALGLTGDAAMLPLLLAALDGSGARAAAEALEVLTGAHLVEDATEHARRPDPELSNEELAARRAGDPSTGVDVVPCRRLCRSQERWNEWLGNNQSRLRPGLRQRAAQPASPAATVALLQRHHLPSRLRRFLAEELPIRWGVPLSFDPTWTVRRQRAALDRADALPAVRGAAAGEWVLSRR